MPDPRRHSRTHPPTAAPPHGRPLPACMHALRRRSAPGGAPCTRDPDPARHPVLTQNCTSWLEPLQLCPALLRGPAGAPARFCATQCMHASLCCPRSCPAATATDMAENPPVATAPSGPICISLVPICSPTHAQLPALATPLAPAFFISKVHTPLIALSHQANLNEPRVARVVASGRAGTPAAGRQPCTHRSRRACICSCSGLLQSGHQVLAGKAIAIEGRSREGMGSHL